MRSTASHFIIKSVEGCKVGYIYKITNKVNGKAYIGQTIQPVEDRWKQHISSAFKENDDKKYAIHYALKKYGAENFDFTVIEEINDELLNVREIYWIKEFNTHYSGGKGYNLTYGGEGGRTADSDEIIKYWNKGLTITQIVKETGYSQPTVSLHLKELGIKSEDIYLRWTLYNSNYFSKTVYQYDLKGNLIREWPSIISITKELGYQKSEICNCLNFKNRSGYGYLWVYNKNDIDKALARYNDNYYKKNRRVAQYTKNGELVQYWDSAELAGRTIGVDPTAIRRCCNHAPRYKTSKGFIWEYAD